MTIPPISEDQYVNRLYDQIRDELAKIFGHSERHAYSLLASYYGKHPEYDEDFYFHQGEFNMALRVHYDQVLGRDTSAPEFVQWRMGYDQIWNERNKHV